MPPRRSLSRNSCFDMNANDALADYLQWLTVEKGRSGATIESYGRDIEQFVGWMSDRTVSISDVGPAQLDEYVNELRRNKAPASVARATASLRGWLGYLADERIISSDPAAILRPAQRGRTLPKPLPEETIGALLDSISGDSPIDLRDRALLEFLYGTGARVSEVVGVSIEDIDFDEELIRVTGKGSKQRLVPMGRVLRSSLRTYLAPGGRNLFPRMRPTSRVFLNQRGGPLSRQGIDLVIAKRALDAGIDRSTISAHVFRHSCATHMLAHGADIRVVQELLGHASIATTQVYTAVSVSSLQHAYESAHPRARG